MAFERNKKATNPNHGISMSVENYEHEILKINKEILKQLDELEANYRERWWNRWKRRNL